MMTHIYTVSGMTCNDCAEKVKKLLMQVHGVVSVEVDRSKGEATIGMHHHINTGELKNALAGTRYDLDEKQAPKPVYTGNEEQKTWWQTYKPVLLIFMYITGATLLLQGLNSRFYFMQWMNHFMAAFFLVFSFFKLLNLQGFADSYTTYDILAKKWRPYAYLYAFIELGLGLAYLSGFYPVLTNLVTFVVMGISLVGVLQSVLNKRKIRCACLGDVFNLPMSTITIIEDALMLVMAGYMLLYLL